MVMNVWMRILPPQRRMIAAAAKGEHFDQTLAAGAKERSKHNTFLAIPTTFIMISSHFPTATYGNHYAVAVLGALILVGWVRGGDSSPRLSDTSRRLSTKSRRHEDTKFA